MLSFLFLCLSLCHAFSSSTSVLPLGSRARACTKPAIRPEWRNMHTTDQLAYVKAEKCLIDKRARTGLADTYSRFEDLQAVHQMYTSLYHNNAVFLPWHRYFLHVHQVLLQQDCGYSGPIPWWDETKDHGHFERAPMFTKQYFGTVPLQVEGTASPCVTDGAFANTPLHIGPGGTRENRPHCLSRAVNNANSHYIDQYYVDVCNGRADYNKMWPCSFRGPHAYGHVAFPGVMSDVAASPGDPIFYLHHAFIDRNWRLWQNKDPKNRVGKISGYTTTNKPKTGWKPLTMGFELTSYGLLPNSTVGDVMNTEGDWLCYRYDY